MGKLTRPRVVAKQRLADVAMPEEVTLSLLVADWQVAVGPKPICHPAKKPLPRDAAGPATDVELALARLVRKWVKPRKWKAVP